jgi:hypothetical protein
MNRLCCFISPVDQSVPYMAVVRQFIDHFSLCKQKGREKFMGRDIVLKTFIM